MTYTPVTPFRRTIDAAILKHQADAQKDLPSQGANKWEVLRELAAGREVFGLTDRDMTVLQTLVSFYPGTLLGGDNLVVHPSNRSICERLNGMPNSTMRRHLGRLVQSGIIVRRDSPNGKRYARRYGDEKIAYGFDLSPLVQRFSEFCEVAEATRARKQRHKRLRETVSLMRRDLAALAEYGETVRPDLSIWDRFSDLAILTSRDLRRKLDLADLMTIEASLKAALETARGALEPPNAEIMSTKEAQSEQHHEDANIDSYELEPDLEKSQRSSGAISIGCLQNKPSEPPSEHHADKKPADDKLPNIPLGLVLASCKEFQTYSDGPIRHWHELVRAAKLVHPMMGISGSAWDDACHLMGPETAAVVVVAILERFTEIKSPGGYLRSLSGKAANGTFSCAPMIVALSRKEAA